MVGSQQELGEQKIAESGLARAGLLTVTGVIQALLSSYCCLSKFIIVSYYSWLTATFNPAARLEWVYAPISV